MTTAKQSWFKRSLSILLTLTMVLSMGVLNVFAAEGKCPTPEYYTEGMSLEGYFASTVKGGVNIVQNGGTADSGYKYYYTIDGTNPTRENYEGSGSILAITKSRLNSWAKDGVLTFKAIATKEGYEDSDVAEIVIRQAPDDAPAFTDAALKTAVMNALGKEGGLDTILTGEDMEKLTELSAPNAGIVDLNGLEYASNLEKLDLSGNTIPVKTLNSLFQSLRGRPVKFPKLKVVNLSNCNLGGEIPTDNVLSSIFLPSLEELNLSNNNLYGTAYLGTMNSYDKTIQYSNLKTVDFSNNNFSGFQFYPTATFDSLEKIDLTQNRIWDDEASTAGDVNWYQKAVEAGIVDKIDFSNQKSLTDLYGVYLDGDSDLHQHTDMVDNTNHIVDLGTVFDDSITFSLIYHGEFGALNVQLVGTDTIKMVDAASAKVGDHVQRTAITWVNLKQGENEQKLLLTHANGETVTYTVKVTASALPTDSSENSAGIVDIALHKAVCTALGKDFSESVTKEEMASLTGTLTVEGVENAEGIQYATGIKTLSLSGADFVSMPDLSPLQENLTSLTLKGYYTEVPGLENLTNLTTLNLSGEEKEGVKPLKDAYQGVFSTPDLQKLTKLKSVEINSTEMETAPVIVSDNLSTLQIAPAKDGSYPNVKDKTIDMLTVYIPTGDDNFVDFVTSIGQVRTVSLYLSPGEYSLDKMDIGKGSGSASITFFASTAEEDVTVDVTGFTADKTTNSQKIKLTVRGGNDSAGVIHLKGSNDQIYSMDLYDGNYIFEEGFSLPGLQRFNYSGGSFLAELPDSFGNLPELTDLNLLAQNFYGDTLPDVFNNAPKLESIKFKNISGAGGERLDFSECTALTEINVSEGGSLFFEADQLPVSLETLYYGGGLFTEAESIDYSKLVNLKSLTINSDSLQVFPYNIVKSLPNLTSLSVSGGKYPDIPADAFDDMKNLTSLTLGSWMKVVDQDEERILQPGTNAATAVATAQQNNPDLNVTIYGYSASSIGRYCNLLSIDSDFGEVRGEPFTTTSLSLYVPVGTTEVVVTPKALYDDTTITVNGKTYRSGESITLPIDSFSETFKLTTHNDFVNYANLPTETDYTLSVVQGTVMEEFIPQDGGVYNLNYHLKMLGTDANSMADNYVTHLSEIRYDADAEEGKKYDIRFTITSTDWITDMKYLTDQGEWVIADTVSEDLEAGTRMYRVYTDNLEERVQISPYVVPMSKWPICQIEFDLTSAVDISGAASVDKADLNAAINKAIDITETRNIYTDASWKNLLEKLEAAQTIAGNDTATQDAVNNAAKELETAMTVGGEGGLVIDESKLANKTALETAINEAKALEKGNHTDTAWNALQEAIVDAQAVYDTLEASQTEVDAAAKSLNTAVTLFQNSGESSTLDKNNLKDGVYSVYGEMIKTNRTEKSMSNDAINHYIKLTVEDGKYYLNMDFHGLAYLNKFGYLAELAYYDNGYTYGLYGTIEGTQIPATVLSTQKNPDGSDLIDEFNQPGGSYEGKLYPDQIKFPLVADALADEDGYVPLHVFVPVMEDISVGTGDQDVLLKLDWSTLKETTEDDPNFKPEEPVEQSPAVDYTDAKTGVKIHADKGVFEEGVQIVVFEITSGADYDAAASSLSDVGKKFKLYDVKFLDADGNEVAPNGTVSISLPITAGYDSANVAAYRLSDGSKILVKGAVENGYYTVITKTAGTYALVEKGSTITDNQNTQNNQNQGGNQNQGNNGNTASPQTGDTSNAGAIALLALAAAGMMGVTVITKKRKSEES